MALTQLVRRPLYLQAAEQLREAIIDGALPPGTELPSERELCSQLGIGRASVREALRALQAQGLVVSTSPTGPFRVTVPEDASASSMRDSLDYLLRLGRIPLQDLVDLRCALESEAVRLAARRQDRDELDAARQAIAEVDASDIDMTAFETADVSFHTHLAAASGNQALHLVMLGVRGSMTAHLHTTLREVDDVGATIDLLTGQHTAILDAAVAGDGELAAHLMRDHIAGFYRQGLKAKE